MNLETTADLVILGAGCAGLSLAARLARANSSLRVIALEERNSYEDDRTWCFWRPPHHDLDHLVSARWSTWRYSDRRGRVAKHNVAGLSYQAVRGADFYAWAHRHISAAPTVAVATGTTVTGLEQHAEHVLVHSTAGTLRARYVVDTRPRRSPALLYQCFAGVEIELDTDRASDTPLDGAVLTGHDSVGLMTDMRADADGLAFTYVLPFTSTRALVEHTRFSAVPLDRESLERELAVELERRGLAAARVLRTEGGVLPMGGARAVASGIPGVVHAGNGGGAIRAATGYAFLRIQRWADECASALLAGGPPVSHPLEPWTRRHIDRIFLQALRAAPEKSSDYLMAMALRVPPAGLVRFLSDHPTSWDFLRIVVSLPFMPFLRQVRPRPELLRVQGVRV